MRIGGMMHRVAIRNPTTTVDAFGQSNESFATVATRWAMVAEIPFGEQQAYDGTENRRRIAVTIRALGSKLITVRSVLLYDSESFNVKSVVDPDGSGKVLEVVAEVLL